MVGRYLGKSQCGPALPEEICSDPLQASVLYELDRRAALPQMQAWLDRGDWIVCDRYTESNLAHQAAKFTDPDEQLAFLEWLILIQEAFELLKPDLTVILSLPQDIRDHRVSERRQGGASHDGQVSEIDRHEQDRPYMERVNGFYPFLAERFGWPVVNCAPDGDQLLVEQVSDLVWDTVNDRFNLKPSPASSR